LNNNNQKSTESGANIKKKWNKASPFVDKCMLAWHTKAINWGN
jgi:hypothetical protein